MSQPPPAGLAERLAALGREIGSREAAHADELTRARSLAEDLRRRAAEALDGFERAAAAAGSPHLRIAVSDTRIDDKHLRAVQFDVARGRHRAVVSVRARGDVTFVGPFHAGKVEGPCRSFPNESSAEIDAALADFLERFLEQAATP